LEKGLILESDFSDYYDHQFDLKVRPGRARLPNSFVVQRISDQGMNRREMFDFFEKNGYNTPLNGIVKDVYAKIPKCLLDHTELVVYVDETSHRGEGKIKLPAKQALEMFPNLFCSEFFKTQMNGCGISRRMIKIGKITAWIEYESQSDWRSNCGVVKNRYLGHQEDDFGVAPLYAIDFIKRGVDLYAIDFNIAPGLKPLQDHISPTILVANIREFFEKRCCDERKDQTDC